MTAVAFGRRSRARGRGRVVLVGGGPGPADLLTVRGRRALAEADVVVADRLGPVGVLAELAPGVEVLDVGKAPGRHAVTQHEINRLLVDRARRGQVVVRLKGGDPFVLGRGGEEVLACREAGVPVEVVPGVTSAVSVPAAADVPVTHRGTARGFAVLSGHGAGDETVDAALCATLVRAGVTVVVLMGASRLGLLAAAVQEHGGDPGTPVAVVENGCTPRQRARHTDLAGLGDLQDVIAPAVVVIGEVAAAGLLDPASAAATVRMVG